MEKSDWSECYNHGTIVVIIILKNEAIALSAGSYYSKAVEYSVFL